MKLFNPGDLFLNRYQIVRALGSGGMSEVYLAQDLNLNENLVAIKFLHLELQQDPTQIKRFQQEILLTRRVNSPFVVKTFDAEISDNHIYFVMEYLEGVSLAELIDSENLELDQIVLILSSILIGLEAVHEVGIIHRDLKAENILVSNEGQLKIMDFGVAKVQKNNLTIAGEIVGSSCYMPPEVWKGDTVSYKADIYSLGVLAYRMLTNQFPFDGENMMQIMYQHLEGEIKEPIRFCPEVPKELNDLILAMLEIDPKLRPELSEIKEILLNIDCSANCSSSENKDSLELASSVSSGAISNLKLINLKSNSYNAKNLANLDPSRPNILSRQSWEIIANLRSLKKVNFSTFRFFIAALLSLSFVILLIFISQNNSPYFVYYLQIQNYLGLSNLTNNYCFHVILFSFIFSLPFFVILFSTVKFFDFIKKFLLSIFCFASLLLIINYSYVGSYPQGMSNQLAWFSPMFWGYLELTLPRAIQHLIDVSLLTPVASQAFISSSNSWNRMVVDLFNDSPLNWILHYNSLIIIIFLVLIINRSNLQFFKIPEEKRYFLPLVLFSLFFIEPHVKEYLLNQSLLVEVIYIFRLGKYEFMLDGFYLICSLINWSFLLGYLFFANRKDGVKKNKINLSLIPDKS